MIINFLNINYVEYFGILLKYFGLIILYNFLIGTEFYL